MTTIRERSGLCTVIVTVDATPEVIAGNELGNPWHLDRKGSQNVQLE